MLKCEGEIKCKHWLLSNSINKHDVDLKQPMLFSEFLVQIGLHLTSLNCQSIFKDSKWFVIDDGVQPKMHLED